MTQFQPVRSVLMSPHCGGWLDGFGGGDFLIRTNIYFERVVCLTALGAAFGPVLFAR